MTLAADYAASALRITGDLTEFPPPFVPSEGTLFTVRNSGRNYRFTGGEWREGNIVSVFNVDAFGAKGNGTTDDTAAIQAAIAAAPLATTIYFPPGTYLVTSTLDFGNTFRNVRGDKGAAMIKGSVNGPLIKMGTSGTGTGPVIEGLFLNNTHASGLGIRLGFFVTAVIRNCIIVAYRAIQATENPFSLHVDACRLLGIGGFPANGVGILSGGHCQVTSTDVVGFAEGMRLFNTNVNVHGCRIEVNVIGLNLGVDDTGAGYILSRSNIAGNSCEGNDEAIRVQNVVSSTIEDVGIRGSVNSPATQSTYGIRITTGSFSAVDFANIEVIGTFSVSGLSANSVSATNVTFRTVNVANTFGGGSTVWAITNPNLFAFLNTNYSSSAFPASVAGGSGFRIPHGVAPTSPVDGDIWTTTAGLFVRVNGSTVGPLS